MSFAMLYYPVPFKEVRRHLVVVNSRFIATLAPVFSVEQAREFIGRVRSEFADATHNVPAYIIGGGEAVLEHCSDDGEPSGTAGRPALAVLKGSGLGDVAVVVTRYFGGTKLGTGGLVRAYSKAVRQVVEAVPRAERLSTVTVMLELPYRWIERLRRMIAAYQGRILDEEFAAEVIVTLRLPEERYPAFEAELQEASNGTLLGVIISQEEELVPLDNPK
jgi:uncharacterized YigZ family protein